MFLTTRLRQIVGRWLSDSEVQLIIDTARELRMETPQLATVWAGDVRGHLYSAAAMLRDGRIQVESDQICVEDAWDLDEPPRYGRKLPECKLRLTRRDPAWHNLSRRRKHEHARLRQQRKLVAA